MPRRTFVVPFAASGDKVSIPTNIQSDGSVSLIQGYGFDYERPTDGTDPLAKVFPRSAHNGLLNEITASLGEIQQLGFAIWAADAAPYPVEAWVRHDDQVWRNTVANNSSQPGSSNSGWVGTSTKGQARFTETGSFVVPPGVTSIIADAIAGGGGGGGSRNSGGGGGGGGAGRSVIRQRYSVTPGSTIPITVGGGGAGGVGVGNSGNATSGSPGGQTVIGSLVTLAGGSGGGAGGALGGGGGGAPGGSFGGDARGFGGDGGVGAGSPFGTAGGSGRAGVGGSSSAKLESGPSGFGFGAGGGGGGASYTTGGNTNNNTSANGTNGMPGIVIIEW